MRLSGQRADEQPGRDLVVGQPARDQRHDLALPVGQAVELAAVGTRPLGPAGDIGDEAPGDRRPGRPTRRCSEIWH
jgi:hypothetical protein